MMEQINNPLLFLAVVLVLAVVLFVAIFIVKRPVKTLQREKYETDWKKVEQMITDDSNTWRLAILDADKLLDRALKESGYKGSTMGERMVSASRVFTKRDAVWIAHKLRNRLAHEDSVKLSPKITKQVLASFKYALKDVGAL